MRRVLMYAIPIVMAVGLLAAVANSPEDGQKLAAPDLEQAGEVTDNTLPAVIESPPVTVPVTSPPAPVVETTTTTAPAPAPTPTTMARPRPAASPRPVSTPPTTAATVPPPVVVQPEAVDCGTGSASARSRLINEAGTYRLVATVVNESTKEIQLDSLVVKATYASGEKTFDVNVGGRIIEARPGQAEMSFDIPESAGPGAPTTFEIAEFRFHTAGLPQCSSQ
ncbi:MAG: hypothetical protein ACRD0O_01870 [Acidimicrobiia bacterium]